MDLLGWNGLLFASKWVFIGLIYFALAIVLVAVRRELSYRVESRGVAAAPIAPGRLKVLAPGSDSRLRSGAAVALGPETTLGAGPENDIVLGDPFVSGRHARLNWDGASWWVEDLGSRNGTYVDRRRCPPHTPTMLPTGGALQVGDVIFELLA
jgi:hypothetical protein